MLKGGERPGAGGMQAGDRLKAAMKETGASDGNTQVHAAPAGVSERVHLLCLRCLHPEERASGTSPQSNSGSRPSHVVGRVGPQVPVSPRPGVRMESAASYPGDWKMTQHREPWGAPPKNGHDVGHKEVILN